MKKKKINFNELKNRLTQKEMRNIMAGSGGGEGGNCKERGESCSTAGTINCCSGLRCVDYKCGIDTFA